MSSFLARAALAAATVAVAIWSLRSGLPLGAVAVVALAVAARRTVEAARAPRRAPMSS